MKQSRDPIGEYFRDEMTKVKVPSFPAEIKGQYRRFRLKDDLIAFAAAAAMLALILTPGIYENPLRKAPVNRACHEELLEAGPLILEEAVAYFQRDK